MEIIRISDTRVKLSLDEEDMKKYGIAVEDMSADTTARRRILWTLLDEAKKRTGVDAAGMKTLIEAFPGKRGGCEVFVTVASGKRELHTACYRFADMRAARAAARVLDGALGEWEKSALYTLASGDIILCISLPREKGICRDTAYGFLEEYGKREKSPHFSAYAKEYGACLYERDAISRLCEENENYSV